MPRHHHTTCDVWKGSVSALLAARSNPAASMRTFWQAVSTPLTGTVRCGAVRQRVLVIIFWLSELSWWLIGDADGVDTLMLQALDDAGWRTAVWPGFHRVIARRCTLMTTWLQWSPLVSPLTSFWHLHLVASLKHASYERACLVYVWNPTTLDHKIIRPTSKWENRDISFKAFSPSEEEEIYCA